MSTATIYPVRVEAELEPGLSRWLWLVKWFLAIPHFIVLSFLWIAFVVLTVIAFIAILFTGRYPRSIFEFNVGVLRWTWRVSDYSFGVLGTDRYPPFTLAEVPEYPAHLEVTYPERLSRGLVLVKWWLLAIPHLLIVGVLAGGGTWLVWNADRGAVAVWGNLIGLLVLIAGFALAFTGRYPNGLFDLILGLNRWVLRVAAYVGLMTDRYPPFRLDLGGNEPGGTLTISRPPEGGSGEPLAEPPHTDAGERGRSGWTGGRITSVVAGSLAGLLSLGLLVTGGAGLWADRTQRDANGFIELGHEMYSTRASALMTERIDVGGLGYRLVPRGILERVQIQVTPVGTDDSVFVGIGPAEAVRTYLADTNRSIVDDLVDPSYRTVEGARPPAWPSGQTFWTEWAAGQGTQSIDWRVTEGSWTVVVMNVDGSSGIAVRAAVAATLPDLFELAIGVLIAGGLLLVGAVLLIVIPIRRAGGGRRGADPEIGLRRDPR